jgi:hypothetical protein
MFLVALALRLVPVVFTRHLGIGLDDMFQYDMLGRSLAAGNGFRWYAPADLARLAPYLRLDLTAMLLDPRGMLTTFRAPLYPGLVSLVYRLNGINDGRFFAVRLAQAVIGAALAPLTYLVSLKVLPDHERVARSAAWVIAAYPMLLLFPIALATENLFFFLLLAAVLSLLNLSSTPASQASEAPGPPPAVIHALLSGVLLGLAALTRSVILPFAALSVLWIWIGLGRRREAVAAALALLLTVAPWVVRNSLLTGRLTGIETSMGYNLYVGYHPQSSGTFTFGPSLDLLSVLNDTARDEIGTQRALDFIRQDPGRFPYLAARRLGYFFNLELRAFTYFYTNDFLGHFPSPMLALILVLLALPFVILAMSAAFGAVLLPWRSATALLALLLAGYLLPHVFILSEERFHLALLPFFAICAANFWKGGFKAWQARGRLAVLSSALIALLLITNWGSELARDWHTIVQMLGEHGNQLYLPY